MTTTVEEMRVWVGCLACYNAGHLVGHWYDANEAGDQTSADVHSTSGTWGDSQVVDLGERDKLFVRAHDGMVFDDLGCPHEELWVFDHEGFGGALKGECSPCEAQRMAEALESLDSDEREVFASWYEEGVYGDMVDAVDDFRDHFHGIWDSEKEFAYNFVDESGDERIKSAADTGYFDWDSYTRDLFFDFTSHDISGYRIGVTSPVY